MKHIITSLFLIIIITVISIGNVFGQKKYKTRLKVEYFKDFNKTERLEATLKVKKKKYKPLSGAQIQFYFIGDSSRTLIDEINTDQEGKAILLFDNESAFVKDSSGSISFEVEYVGNDSAKASKKATSIKQSKLEILFFQEDSIKSIEVRAFEINADDQFVPLEGIDIVYYVQGTFSLLKFEKVETDIEGITQVPFPIDMPGDTAGIMTIVVKIDDDKVYGTVTSQGEMNWGIPIQPVLEKQRGLGDTDAPLWMVYTLIILLSVVWLHYMYVVFLIYKIKMAK